MKKLFTLAFFLCLTINAFAQTDGITYQAVIIGPDALELPGVDSEGNYLPNTTVTIRFTIIDTPNTVEFQEIQTATTDDFGRINLIIGSTNPDDFQRISWDGTPKDLEVEIDFDAGSNFETMSREQLTFLPYAYHRNITATGTLTVDDNTYLNGELTVELPTNLNSTLDVVNETHLMSDLTVDGETNLNNPFNVNNGSPSNLSGNLGVDGNTLLNGTLDVIGQTTLNDLEVNGQAAFGDLNATNLTVTESTTLYGKTIIDGGSTTTTDPLNGGEQIVLRVSRPNNGNSIGNHPVLIEGGNNGLAIRVIGSRTNNNNFISFFDSTNGTTMWGRIEGETPSEYGNNADWLFDQSSLDYDIYDAWVDYGFALANEIIAGAQMVKAASDYRPCTGFGACIVTPGPADIIFSGLEMISATAQAIAAALAIDRAEDNKDIYNANKDLYQGVTYASGAGDYAEYLLRADRKETMTYGDIVGMSGGKISKNTVEAERMMVVSYKPIVLGNMPQSKKENYEKVAFMGQVPVKVFGKVKIGDYIIPSGKNDGVGVAISPSEISTKNVKKIVGIAWENSESVAGFNMVNVAVGLNKNDNNPILIQLEEKIKQQAHEISSLKNEIAKIHELLSNNANTDSTHQTTHLTHESDEENNVKEYDERRHEFLDTPRGEIVYFEMTREDFEKGLEMAQEQMLAQGIDVENHVFWKKIKTDPVFKQEIMDRIMAKLDKQIHYHKEISLKPGN